MSIKFNRIDVESWPRAQMFHYFTEMVPTGYSLTVELDITEFKKRLRDKEIKFFPAYIWLVTKVLNKQSEFKIANVDGELGYWETLTPLYPHFHEDDKTISFMWTEYSDDFEVFYNRYLENKELYGDTHGVLSQPHIMPPLNAYTVSCIPWLEFKHFALQSFGNKDYYFPTIEAGKYFERYGLLIMPLSITVHHATTDGWHINGFVEELQRGMDSWEEGIS